MPFVEVFDFRATAQQRETATRKMTEALCDSYGIPQDIVSAYFIDVGRDGYGHDGVFAENAREKRIFVKLHAFRRSEAMRRAAAQSLTRAVVDAYGTTPESVAVYFLDREPDEVAHGGSLASD